MFHSFKYASDGLVNMVFIFWFLFSTMCNGCQALIIKTHYRCFECPNTVLCVIVMDLKISQQCKCVCIFTMVSILFIQYYLFSIITYTSYNLQSACETDSSGIQRCLQNPFKQLRWIVSCSILNIWQGSEYASINRNWKNIIELGKCKARFLKLNFKKLLGCVSKNICTSLFQSICFIFRGMP